MESVDVMDDVLVAVFNTLAADFAPGNGHKKAITRFIWFRTTLPLVCKRWHRLVLEAPPLWSNVIIDPTAEAQHAKRLGRSNDVSGCPSGREPRGGSEGSSPARAASPALGSSPESDSGSYWTSVYAPYQTGLPPSSPQSNLFHKQLSRISLSKQSHHRTKLHAEAVTAWLRKYPAAAGVTRLTIDLTHHSHHDFDRQQLDRLLAALPRLQCVHMIGAVDVTDAYEPLGRVRSLQELQLTSASQACLDNGLMALGFLPSLQHLAVSLDIHPAMPWCLSDLPTGLVSLELGRMWLQQLPPVLEALTGLTSITLERCQIEQNPLPLMVTLPQLSSVTIRNVSKAASSVSCMTTLLPMTKPQQQLPQLQQPAAAMHRAGSGSSRGSSPAGSKSPVQRGLGGSGAGRAGSGGASALGLRTSSSPLRDLARVSADSNSSTASTAAKSSSSSSSLRLVNTSIKSLALVDVGLHAVPSCISQLVALQELNLALNHEMGLNPGACLPSELALLTGLQSLCLGHCGLNQIPPVLASCSKLTRLELEGNALSVSGFGWQPADVGFRDTLQVLDLGGQGSARSRMRGIPAWVGSCHALRELRLGAQCLGYGSGAVKHMDFSMSVQMSASGPATTGHVVAAAQAGLLPVSRRLSVDAPLPAAFGGGAAAAEGLSVQQLPELLPQLEVLRVDGGVWEQRAVRDALQLVRQLERTGSRLQVILPL